MKKLNFLLADDHPVVREGLKKTLAAQDFCGDIREAANGKIAVQQCVDHAIDFLFIDFNMPEMDGYDAAKIITSRHPRINIIVLTFYDELSIALHFFRLGAKGFISKVGGDEEIIAAVRSVSLGDYYFHSRHDEEIAERLLSGLEKNIPAIRFTPRELEVAMLISKGLSAKEIGESYGMAESTVAEHRQNMMKKAGVHSSPALVDYVYRHGLMISSNVSQNAELLNRVVS